MTLSFTLLACSASEDEDQSPSLLESDSGSMDSGTPTDAGTPSDPNAPALDECGLETEYLGDEFCILPPPADRGFQVHYGPSDYDDPVEVARYILEPGGETNIYEPAVSGNTEDVFFYKRQYRMRAGSHHLIISETGGAGAGLGSSRRLGGSQNTVKDNPTGPTPPENENIGMPLSARASLSLNLHHFNPTDQPILKEAWVNFWYVAPSQVEEQAEEMFLWGVGGSVPPGGTALQGGSRTISEPGRILTMYGHRHSNAVRFSAWHTRDGNKELVYEDYDWEEPTVLEFNSVTTNPLPDSMARSAGGHSGILPLEPGDELTWECEVINERNVTITFGANEAETSEMCILIGDAVGPRLR